MTKILAKNFDDKAVLYRVGKVLGVVLNYLEEGFKKKRFRGNTPSKYRRLNKGLTSLS